MLLIERVNNNRFSTRFNTVRLNKNKISTSLRNFNCVDKESVNKLSIFVKTTHHLHERVALATTK